MIHGVRVRCPTVERSPIKSVDRKYPKSRGKSTIKNPKNSLDTFPHSLYYFVYKLISQPAKKVLVAQYEDCIVFLLAKAYQKAHSAFKQKLTPFGITPVQHLILAVLAEKEFVSPAEISDQIAMDGATLSGVLERMTEAGLIKKEENAEDRRSIRVSLTSRAKKMRVDLAEQRKAINEELTARLSLEERLLLKRLLKDLKG